MFIHDRFVFIHMPKTAGTFLSDALKSELSMAEVSPDDLYLGWKAIPAEAAGRPVLTYIRNPWEWYVSWYHFIPKWIRTQPPERFRKDDVIHRIWRGSIYNETIVEGVNDFATIIRNACDFLTPKKEKLAEAIDKGLISANLFTAGHDYYTVRFKQITGAGFDSDLLTVGRYESLLPDLERFFTRVGIPLDDCLRERVESGEPLNVGDRRPYREYYDDALRDLIGASCRTLIERFGYSF